MNGMKLIAFGFLLTFLGIGILAVLAIPNASLALANAFITSPDLGGQSLAPVTSFGQTFSMFDPSFVAAAQTFQRVGEIITFSLLITGLAAAGYGTFRKA